MGSKRILNTMMSTALLLFGLFIVLYTFLVSSDIPVVVTASNVAMVILFNLAYIALHFVYASRGSGKMKAFNLFITVLFSLFWFFEVKRDLRYDYHQLDTTNSIICLITNLVVLIIYTLKNSRNS